MTTLKECGLDLPLKRVYKESATVDAVLIDPSTGSG